jgi:hypothetical protein
MSNPYEAMKFMMKLRGYFPNTQRHYLNHVKLLEKHSGKPPIQISPDEIKQYLHSRIKKASVTVILISPAMPSRSYLTRSWAADGPMMSLSGQISQRNYPMSYLWMKFYLSWSISQTLSTKPCFLPPIRPVFV